MSSYLLSLTSYLLSLRHTLLINILLQIMTYLITNHDPLCASIFKSYITFHAGTLLHPKHVLARFTNNRTDRVDRNV